MKFLRDRYFKIAAYAVGAFSVSMVIAMIILHFQSIWNAFQEVWKMFNAFFKPGLIGFSIAYLLFPITRKLNDFLNALHQLVFQKVFQKKNNGEMAMGASRKYWGLSVALTWVIIIVAISTILTVLISSITENLEIVSIMDIGNAINAVQNIFNEFYDKAATFLNSFNIAGTAISDTAQNIGQTIIHWLSSTGNHALSYFGSFASSVSTLIFSVIFSVYLMLDGEKIMAYWKRAFSLIIPEKIYRGGAVFIKDADKAFSGYIRGQMADAVFMAVVFSIVFSILNVPYAVVIGILAGLGNLVPYVGAFVAYGGTILTCLMAGDLKKMLIALVTVFIVMTIDGNIVNPKLLSKSIQVHPLLVVAALLIGSAVGGLLGMLLAVPVGALAKMEFERFLQYRENKRASKENLKLYDI